MYQYKMMMMVMMMMMMMIIIIMTSPGFFSHTYCCSRFDPFNFYNNFCVSIKHAHRIFTFDCLSSYPNTAFIFSRLLRVGGV